jgi:SAM-dependent methyltransferase
VHKRWDCTAVVSVNIHAAAVDGEFWGTDFNPSQVMLARALAEASSSGAKLFEDSFAELAARPDLPEFDIIGLHGIWTWISDENSRVIVDLIRHKLRAGGIVYISYNCLPGWAPAVPLRRLMKLHADFAAGGERPSRKAGRGGLIRPAGNRLRRAFFPRQSGGC